MANKRSYDDLSTGVIAYATFLSCIVLIITILGVRALSAAWLEGELERKSATASYHAADEKIREQLGRLDGYKTDMVPVAEPSPAPAGDKSDPAEAAQSQEKAEPKLERHYYIDIDQAEKLLLQELGTDEQPNT